MIAATVNDLGLAIDIVGALILFKYGLPADIDRRGRVYRVTDAVDHAEIRKGKIYDRWGKIGLILLVAGFALQLASNHIAS